MAKLGMMALALVAAATPALAASEGELADPYGASYILKGRQHLVQPRLQAAFQRGDRRPEVLLNLAAARLNEQDGNSARMLYQIVLTQPNFDMATPRGTAWSHDIARRGMARVTQ